MTIVVTHACRTCHTAVDVTACTRCHRAFYCSKKCQKLDWDTHRKFCLKSASQELEIARRERCLELIHAASNTSFQFLMQQKRQAQPGFMAIGEKLNPKFMPKISLEDLTTLDAPDDKIIHDELQHEISHPAKTPSMVVMYIDHLTVKVYVVSSKEFSGLHAAIKSMPDLLVHKIFNEDLKSAYNKELKQMMLKHYLAKLLK
jgi:MYND finger